MELDGNLGLTERRDVDTALDALYDYNSGEGRSLELTKKLARLEDEWGRVPQAASGGPAVEHALTTALEVFDLIDDRSSLSADPDGETADLIDAYGSQLPMLTAQTDRAKLLLVRKMKATGTDNRIVSAMALGMARHAFGAAHRDVQAAASSDSEMVSVSKGLDRVGESLDLFWALDDRSGNAKSGATLEEARDRGDQTLEAVYKTQSDLATSLRDRLEEREAREQRSLALLHIETLLAFAVAFGFAVLLGKSIRDRDRRDLSRARSEAERLANELDRQRRLDALAVTEAQLRAVFDRSSIGVAILDGDGTVLRSKPRAQRNARAH